MAGEARPRSYKPGESGLLALDWWNGNRSVLVDTDLTGIIVGCTLLTKPEEIYRALLEATAFGTRKIVDAFHSNGVEVKELYACGGLPQKNRLLMQIYADVTNREIKVAASKQTPALGAAMFGAVAAGAAAGGYDSIVEAAKRWRACGRRRSSRSRRTWRSTRSCTRNTRCCTTISAAAPTM